MLGLGTIGCQDSQHCNVSRTATPSQETQRHLFQETSEIFRSSAHLQTEELFHLLPRVLGRFISFGNVTEAFSKASSRSPSEQKTCAAHKGGCNRSLKGRADCFPRPAHTVEAHEDTNVLYSNVVGHFPVENKGMLGEGQENPIITIPSLSQAG